MKDYYEILEVSRKASKDTINKVFKMHMKANHPDLFQGDEKIKAEEKSKELTEAYNVWSDDLEREKYDAQLQEEEAATSDNSQLIQENEYLKQLVAQKDEILTRLTGRDYSQYNNYANPSMQGDQYNYQDPYQAQQQQQYYNGFSQREENPYEGMTLEELKKLKKEQTKQYYISLAKNIGIKVLILALLIIVMFISLMSSLKDLGNMFK